MREIRSCGHAVQSRVPIIIISARAFDASAAKVCIEIGADGFCPKPFTAASLQAELSRLRVSGRLKANVQHIVAAAAAASSL
eukprot:19162-Heterococcus_DN1.PRE.1